MAFHNPSEPNQNLGNRMGERSSVKQSQIGRVYDSGNEMKGILGSGTAWNLEQKDAYRHPRGEVPTKAELTDKIGGGRQQGFMNQSRANKSAEITGKIGGLASGGAQPREYDGRDQYGEPMVAGITKSTRYQGSRAPAPQQGGGNPLSWDMNESWQTSSSSTGAFYQRRG
jgi:hypothetical protein